jgi:hypothetical protein
MVVHDREKVETSGCRCLKVATAFSGTTYMSTQRLKHKSSVQYMAMLYCYRVTKYIYCTPMWSIHHHLILIEQSVCMDWSCAWEQYVHIHQIKYSEKKTEKSPEMPGIEGGHVACVSDLWVVVGVINGTVISCINLIVAGWSRLTTTPTFLELAS